MPTRDHTVLAGVNVSVATWCDGRFSGVHQWPVLGVHRGQGCFESTASLHHGLLSAPSWRTVIGEADSRYRRTVPTRAAAERLMRLDAALISPELDWLTTRSEKVAYLRESTPARSSEPFAELPIQDRLDLFPGTFPIGIDGMGRAVLVYLATRHWTDDLRSFLAGHLPLLAVTPTWTLRI